MGRRSEQRIAISFPVIVRGSDSRGNQFTVATKTFDISASGASVKGLTSVTEPGGKVRIEFGDQSALYGVQWVGKAGSPEAGRIGVRCLDVGKYIWSVPPKESEPDMYDPLKPQPAARRVAASAGAYGSPPSFGGDERRKFARHTCRIETEVLAEGSSAGVFGTVADLSLGGCYVEMLSPLPVDTLIRLSLNLGTATLRLSGRVCSSQMGFGMGVSFTEMGPEDFEILRRFAPPAADSEAPAKVSSIRPPRLLERTPRQKPTGAMARSYSETESNRGSSSTAEALDALVRLLLQKEIFTQGELAEEYERSKAVK
jgi:PilZ domain